MPTLTHALALCIVNRFLRPFIDRPDAKFLAAIVVRIEGMADAIEVACDVVLNGRAKAGSFPGGRNAVIEQITDSKKQRGLLARVQEPNALVLIFQNTKLVPDQIRDFADVYHVIEEIDPRLMKAAIYQTFATEVSMSDAQFIAKQPLDDWLVAFRSGRPVQRSLRLLRGMDEPRQAAAGRTKSIRLEELHGYGEAKQWGLELALDLTRYRRGEIAWTDVEPGLLLSGPSGVGKTRFAEALATTCGVPLIHGSYARWQSAGHQGEMLAAMRDAFEMAKAAAPAILLIDELDSFESRAIEGSHSRTYTRQVVNGFLECLDGAAQRSGVIVIGTTNYPEMIDPAVLRPGRFDRHIAIALPDATARLAILRQYLPTSIPSSQETRLTDETKGMSGAELKQLARESRRRARGLNRSVLADDVLACLPETHVVPADRLAILSIHEVGHAIVALAFGRTIESIRIADRYRVDVGQGFDLGTVRLGNEGLRRTARTYQRDICVALAGVAAEIELVGEHGDGASGHPDADINKATYLATLVEGVLGFGETLVVEHSPYDYNELSRMRLRSPHLWARVDRLLASRMQETRRIIAENRLAIQALAAELTTRKTMTGTEVSEFLKSVGHVVVAATEFAEEKRDDTSARQPRLERVN
ncbi:ATP-dependent Zn protease [Rhizobium leguminosarum]|uniref:ATP-dependent Zn protease n=1 Tax=Rhizobium leguminosarum TaxID=384 RepID=A0AAE2SYC7_RHILE|nr:MULTISPECIES: AAA family ATPase [Rhizobium]MBB4291419.1 ATP-dependent Zn protease [Rhizobium leguminosarum]MBB4297486.1 ATP-dependent Zn protease [Rhizobium leguminosarum]MBB4308626.1 ATP-dependent Zn protease [Rhizobium leguminosarum]MBB4416461.1 ATP-dependent Zn protease [Rhizobium leguminosarum]MBB4430572.1 ATP-dependent Zn protease [Rhizobium esperanzae]